MAGADAVIALLLSVRHPQKTLNKNYTGEMTLHDL